LKVLYKNFLLNGVNSDEFKNFVKEKVPQTLRMPLIKILKEWSSKNAK